MSSYVRKCITSSAAVLVCTVTFAADGAVVDITECGQIVPERGTGILQVDLDCPRGVDNRGVVLERKATLDLNGHVIRGARISVDCPGSRCFIHGPGEISGSEGYGIRSNRGRVAVENVILSDHAVIAISVGFGRGMAKLMDVTVERTNTTPGISISGIMAAKIRATNLVLRDNGGPTALSCTKFVGDNVTLDGNQQPLRMLRGRITNLTATNSKYEAILAYRRVRISDSVLSNNGTVGDGVDLGSVMRPRLRNTTCSRSAVCTSRAPAFGCVPDGSTWRVCENDF